MTWPPAIRKLTALLQVVLMLSLTACSTATSKKAPRPSDYRVTVAPEPPGAPAPPAAGEATKPGSVTSPGAVTPPPASSPPVVITPPTGPITVAPPASGTAEPQPGVPSVQDRGPAVRLRQAQTAPSPGQPPAQAPGRLVVFNFDNADIEIVLQATSELLVFNYVLAPEARGKKVTVQTTGRIPVDDIFPVLLTILDVNGLAAIKSGSVYRIIAKQGSPQTSTRTIVGGQLDPAVPGDEVLTQVVPLKFTNAVEVAGLLRPFVPQQGAITAHRDSNLLVITDVAANVRRLLDILKLVDVDVASNELLIVQLKHADAQEVAQILNQLFATGRFRTGAQLPAGVTPPAPAPAAPGVARPPAAPAPIDSSAAAERAPLIVPEKRSNSLIIYARRQEMETISRLIEKLDADIYGGQRIFFYFCENTKAKELGATLDAIFGRGTGAAPQQPGQQPTRPGTTTPGLPTQSQIQRPTPAATPAGAGGIGALLGEGVPVGAETRFIPDEVTNSIIVTTYPRVWNEILDIIKKLDRMPRQVLIEVLAAEVTLDDRTSLGVEWAIRQGRFDVNFSGSGVLPSRPPHELLDPALGLLGGAGMLRGTTPLAGLNFFTFAANQFLAAINALANEDKVNILSSPSVMTTENKKAIINVSKSVPVLTSQQAVVGGTISTSATNTTGIVGTQTVEYKDVGIVLTVTPRIGEQGTVALDVKQEVNDILGEQIGNTGSPAFSKREAETSVVLLNNQTLVLGGLIQNRKEMIRTGIPFLNKIPVLGYLFGNTSQNITKTELLLLITPRVVGTPLDATRITDQMRRITPELKESIKEKQFPYPSFEYMRP
ncbi:MAG TPA: type II secretion system secretin GspD [Methylomirabilota bacterium]|nr:type II secretion system secretin GspD [Methylomirabilota bacterium]